MRKKIENYVKAGYSGLVVVSWEERRVEADLIAVAKATGFSLSAWSITEGIVDCMTGMNSGANDPLEMLEAFGKLPEKSILLARDFHLILADGNPVLVRKLKDCLALGKASNRVFVINGCTLKLPAELEKEMVVIEAKLPSKSELLTVLEGIATSAGIVLNGNREPLLDAASGLTVQEAENAFALSVVEAKDLVASIISREKAATISKRGILEVVETALTLDDMGGLDLYKDHIWSIRNCFGQAAKDYGLPSPRPVICCGQPGTGKSMSAMACRSVFGLPLLRLEAGRLFSGLVGASEENWRSAFATVKAIAPAILWIDEAEGLFSGMQSSGQTDGGTTQRVTKAILQDMQFNGDGLFFVFTSNDIDQFPDPLIDRCDVWSFELPTKQERESIWKIHIAKRNRKPDAFDIPRLADNTDGYSGRQIEQIWIKALTIGFNDNGREVSNRDVDQALKFFVPTSVTMKDAIERRRQRLQNRARSASSVEAKSDKRKIAFN